MGYGTRVRNPKAIVAYSEEGATGKSVYLELLRALPNPEAVAACRPASSATRSSPSGSSARC